MTMGGRTGQGTWSRGVLAEDLWHRSDLDLAGKSAAVIDNLKSIAHGGLARRPGSRVLADLGDAATPVRLKDHVVDPAPSGGSRYLVALLPEAANIYKDAAEVAALSGMPWLADQVAALDMQGTLETLAYFHPDLVPGRLLRLGIDTGWAREDLTLTNIPKHEFGRSFIAEDLTLSAVAVGSRTLTLSGAFFEADDVGATIGAGAGRATITAYTNPTTVTANVTVAFAAVGHAAKTWWLDRDTASVKAEDVWSARRGWPGSGGWHDGRLYFGGAPGRISTIWGSKVDKYFDFAVATEPLDDDSVETTLTEGKTPALRRFYSLNRAYLLTSAGIYTVTAKPITPDDFMPERQSALEVSPIDPVEVEGAVVLIGAGGADGGQSPYEMLYDGSKEGFSVVDIGFTAADLFKSGIVDMGYAVMPEREAANLLLLACGDGTLAVLNTRRSEKIAAWTRWVMKDAAVRQVEAVGGKIYAVVARGGRVYLEYFDPDAALDAEVILTSEAASQDEWTLPEYLRGKTCVVHGRLAVDGLWRDLGDFEVDETGVIATPDLKQIRAGIGIEWELVPLPAELKRDDGVGLSGRLHRAWRFGIQLRDTQELELDGRPVSLGQQQIGGPPPSFTGLVEKRRLGWHRGGVVNAGTGRLSGSRGWPVHILGINRDIAAG